MDISWETAIRTALTRVVNRNNDATSFYTFLVDNEGAYVLAYQQNGSWDILIPWALSEAILLDQGVNHLTVSHQETTVSVYANETLLASKDVGSAISGRAGVIVMSYDTPFDVRFDNVRAFSASVSGHMQNAVDHAAHTAFPRNMQSP